MTLDSCDQPLVSVVLPVYNRERFVAETLRSLLAQTHTVLEVIPVVDEGSKDQSAQIVSELAATDPRLRPLFLSHGSQWRARNYGVALARGAYIAHMDDDDIALPHRITAQLAWMRQTGAEMCGGCTKRSGTQSGLLWFPETHLAICHELLFRIAVFLPTLTLRADIAKAHPYDETLAYADYAWLTQQASCFRYSNLPQVLLISRYHSDQIHVTQEKEFQRDQNKYREPLFFSLFPEATAEDYAIVAAVTEKRPVATLTGLERAGEWLVRLSQTSDHYLRQKMAERWRTTCRQSASLGVQSYRLYRQVLPQFGDLPVQEGLKRLWLICALRLAPGSPLLKALKAVQRKKPADAFA